MGKRKGVGRGLEAYEVALIKNMRQRGMARDFIMSLIFRPGRVISPAAVGEVMKGKIGPEIAAATDQETDAFIQMRIAGTSRIGARDLGGPTSQTIVLEVLQAARTSDANYAALESRTLEFKERLPGDKASRCAIARTMAAFANTGGGYVIFGVQDDRAVIGLANAEQFQDVCDQLSDIVTECFSPALQWDKSVVAYGQQKLGVIYTYRAAIKPVVAMRDASDIQKSTIYFRYEGKSQRIEPGDLLEMLRQREQAAIAVASPPSEFHA